MNSSSKVSKLPLLGINSRFFSAIYMGVAMDTEPYPVVAGLLIRKAVT